MNEERTYGRYDVALDSGLELRDYREFPPLAQLRELPNDMTPITIDFSGRRFTWHPGGDEFLPVVTTPILSRDDDHEERRAMLRFLSALSFEFGSPIVIYTSAASAFKKEFDPPFLQQPRLKATIFPAPATVEVEDDPDLRLCLAFTREGVSARSEALRFLSLFKALEVAVGEGAVNPWIDRNAPSVSESPLPPNGWSVHLREARHSAAHAVRTNPDDRHYDPDDPRHSMTLSADARTIWLLAHEAITSRWSPPVRLARRH